MGPKLSNMHVLHGCLAVASRCKGSNSHLGTSCHVMLLHLCKRSTIHLITLNNMQVEASRPLEAHITMITENLMQLVGWHNNAG